MRRVPAFDMPLFLCFLILIGLGITFIYTASYPKAMVLPEAGGNSSYFAMRQAVFVVCGLLAMFACILVPLERLRELKWWIFGAVIISLLGLFPFAAATHGNINWYKLGPVQIQPSEFAKVGLVLVLSAYLASRPWMVKSWRGLLTGPLLIVFVPVVIIVGQRDLGTVFVILMSSVAFLAIAGTKFRFWGYPLLVLGAVGVLVMISGPRVLYKVMGARAERFVAWQNPMDTSIKESYQPLHSLIAVGSGGLLGRGFCQSREKWFYLPGAQNDYIMAVIAEEIGFLRILLILFVPYLFFIYRGFSIAHRAPDEYTALIASGATAFLAVQALINMAVVLNLLPCMGINLPFISYGGSSIIASMMMAGLILNVSSLRPVRKSVAPTPDGAKAPLAG
ncbi:MAG: FtsW/RodA/SpoVE family cell cycle protein [Armatimonadota bacterium]